MSPIDALAEVLARHTKALMGVDGVVGIYESRLADGSPSITIMVVKVDDNLRQVLPRTLEGYPVLLDAGGDIRPIS